MGWRGGVVGAIVVAVCSESRGKGHQYIQLINYWAHPFNSQIEGRRGTHYSYIVSYTGLNFHCIFIRSRFLHID